MSVISDDRTEQVVLVNTTAAKCKMAKQDALLLYHHGGEELCIKTSLCKREEKYVERINRRKKKKKIRKAALSIWNKKVKTLS